jgi:hypothetical protein
MRYTLDKPAPFHLEWPRAVTGNGASCGLSPVASTRIADLCRALEMTPNDLFGVSSEMDSDVSKISVWTMRVALKLEDASPAMRQAIDAMLNAGPKR